MMETYLKDDMLPESVDYTGDYVLSARIGEFIVIGGFEERTERFNGWNGFKFFRETILATCTDASSRS